MCEYNFKDTIFKKEFMRKVLRNNNLFQLKEVKPQKHRSISVIFVHYKMTEIFHFLEFIISLFLLRSENTTFNNSHCFLILST